jgi:hypothetical protein
VSAILWFMLASVAATVIYCGVMRFRLRGTDPWPSVSGKIESYDRPRYVNTSSALCFTNVNYSYSVGDDYYAGVWLTPTLSNLRALEQFLAIDMPLGKSFRVRYKPGQPSAACWRTRRPRNPATI